ncbi:MAG: potassium channel family protein [Filifactoraceae bacterium]
MKKLKVLWRVLTTVGMDKVITGFMVMFFVIALLIQWVEPNINGIGNGIWYAFSTITTIGFGDLTAVTFAGRVLTGILAMYGILVIAMIPGILVNYFTEINKIKTNESVIEFFDKLEHLDSLSEEELRNLSKVIKEKRNKI